MRKQSTPIDLVDLALFARVVEQRSFSGAARALRTTTSAASKRVAHLEQRLGVRLLERTTRRVVPTEAGAAFYARAARILSDVDDAENEVARLGGEPRGTLRVSVPVIFGERHVAPLLPAFLARHPDVRVDLSLSDAFVNLVAERVDVALRIGPLVDSTLVRARVGWAASVVIAAPSYLARAGTPAHPRDLAGHQCIRYSQVTVAQEWRFQGRRGEEAVAAVGRVDCNHGGAMLEAAMAGLGLAKLPDFLVADAVRTGRVVRVLDAFALPPSGIHLVYPGGAVPLPKLAVFVEEMGAALRKRLAGLRV